jgi:hypothetical protein
MIIRDIFANIVSKIKVNDIDVSFKFGYWTTVANELSSEGRSKILQDTRYPLIFLHADVTEVSDSRQYVLGTNPSIYIMDQTRKNWNIEERLENVYIPKLYPIYYELIRQIRKCKQIESTVDIHRSKKDLFYLQNIDPNQNKINDIIDCIEVKFNDLRIYTNPLK